MINRSIAALAAATVITFAASPASASEGELAMFANGEELATDGFVAPKLTRDGWELRFDHIYATVSDISIYQTETPYDAEKGGEPVAKVTVAIDTDGPVTLDLTDAGEDGRVRIGAASAPDGHYNAVSWSVVPAVAGEWEGRSMVFIGTATKDGQSVPFTLTSTDVHVYTCGEYVGDDRKGFVESSGSADLELTFHLDHIFGRADRDADGAMNAGAAGFDGFAEGGTQTIDLSGMHIGHVGEGHCAVEYR